MSETIQIDSPTSETTQHLPPDISPFMRVAITGKNEEAVKREEPAPKPTEAAPKAPEKKAPAPAPAKEAPKAAATEDDDDESKWVPPSDIKSEKGIEGWKEVKRSAKLARAEAKQAKAEAEALRKQLAERTTPVVPEDFQAEFEATKKERDELSERLKIADVTSHPRFKAYFDGKMTQYVEAAKAIVGGENGQRIERIIKISDPDVRAERLDELMEELTDSRKSRLGAVITNLELLEQEKQAEISRASERSAQLQQASKAEQEQAIQAKRAMADRLVQAAITSGMEAFKADEGADADRLAEIEKYKGFVLDATTGKLDAQDAQFLPLAAVQGLHLKTKVVPALEARIKELEQSIREYEGTKPRGGGGTGTDVAPKKEGFMAAMGFGQQ